MWSLLSSWNLFLFTKLEIKFLKLNYAQFTKQEYDAWNNTQILFNDTKGEKYFKRLFYIDITNIMLMIGN